MSGSAICVGGGRTASRRPGPQTGIDNFRNLSNCTIHNKLDNYALKCHIRQSTIFDRKWGNVQYKFRLKYLLKIKANLLFHPLSINN